MPTPIPNDRLPGLKKALAELGEDEWMAQQQLADLYGVVNSRLTTLIKKRFTDFPQHERRDDKTHWYPARAAVASMIRYMEDSARGKQVQARRHAAVMGGVKETRDAAATEEVPLTAAEIDRMAGAQMKLFQLAQLKGQYVQVADLQRTMRGMLQLIAREVTNIPNAIDPNGQLPADKRARLTNKCREVLVKMHDEVAAYLGELDADDDGAERSGSGAAIPIQPRRAPPRRRAAAGAA